MKRLPARDDKSVPEYLPWKAKRVWVEPERIDALTAIHRYPGRTLLMVWPCRDKEWSREALDEYARTGGRKLIYVGEYGEGSCTATQSFFALLEARWRRTQIIEMPHWSFLHDSCGVYEITPDP